MRFNVDSTMNILKDLFVLHFFIDVIYKLSISWVSMATPSERPWEFSMV